MKHAALMVLRWSAAIALGIVACPLLVIVVLLLCATVAALWIAADLTRPEWAKSSPGSGGATEQLRGRIAPDGTAPTDSVVPGSLTGSLTAPRRRSAEFYVQFGPCGREQ